MTDKLMTDKLTTDKLTTDRAESDERQDALIAALMDLERHVSTSGWDQRARLFALVHTDDVIGAEPRLAAQLGLRSLADGAPVDTLTAIEQEEFAVEGDILADLTAIVWPDSVFGCAIALERTFLPAGAEGDLPDDVAAAADFVAQHPQRQDVRVVVAVDRDGHHHGVARLVSQPDELLGSADLVPGLAEALAHTLAEP